MPVPAPRSKIAPKKAPQSDPKFQRVAGRLNSGAVRLKQHPPARSKAAQAQAAAVPPAKEKLSGAQAKQVDKMQQAKPKPVEPNGFLVMLRAEIEKVMPQNLDEADKFMEGGEQQQMKGAVTGKVNAQKDAATGEVKASTKQAPDASSVPGKQVTPIPGEPAPVRPQLNAGQGMPSPKPEAEVTQKDYKDNADQQLKDAEVTPTQLKKANDPRFSAVLTAKDAVEKTADAAPAKYRAAEKGTLAQAVVKATGDARTGAAALVGAKSRSGTAVRARQNAAKERDEKRRKEVTDTIEGIYNSTKASVEAKLGGLETQVTSMFDAGASAAIANMKANSNREIEDFKDDRYSGIRGKARWLADLFRPVPQGIKDILARNRVRFTQEMDGLIVNIATIVDTRLREAKGEIDKGQTKIKAYVASLPLDLQKVGRAAEQEVAGRFDELRQSVDDKKNDLAQKLAQKYKEASDKADAELKKIEEANAGALRGLIDKLAEIIRILADFKNKLVSLIRKGMATIKLIIADPIGFLGNIIAAIKQGIELFKTNFFKHLQDAFIKWLFGAMSGAGIQLPANLSLPEILKFVLSVLGITYEKMRQKAVKLLGPTAVAIIEKVVEYVKALIQGGPAALWEKVKEDLSNLKAMVIDAIIAWVTETIVKQAVAKIVSMFNPAGAIIQAIIAIYNVVMFVIERASQIMTFVEAVINSVHDIATGAIGGAAKKIETALATALVLVISFLARLIGLGGISQKVKEFITKVQNVVDKAIDKAIGKVVDVVKKLFGKQDKGGKQAGEFPDIDTPAQLGNESHTIRVHLDGENVVVLMASDSFGRMREKLDTLSKTYAAPFREFDANKVADDIDKQINAVKKVIERGERDMTKRLKGVTDPFKRSTIYREGATSASSEMRDALLKLGKQLSTGKLGKAIFGKAAKLKPGDAVVFLDPVRAMVVREVKQLKEIGGQYELMFTAESADGSFKSPLLYREEGIKWQLTNKPHHEPFKAQGIGGRVVIDKAHLNSGSPASHDPPFLGQTIGGKLYAIRGHLVAKVFGGPGGQNNIVALTAKANERMRSGIEVPLSKGIKTEDSVVEYVARPIYLGGNASQPVDSVEIEAIKTYPNKQPKKVGYPPIRND